MQIKTFFVLLYEFIGTLHSYEKPFSKAINFARVIVKCSSQRQFFTACRHAIKLFKIKTMIFTLINRRIILLNHIALLASIHKAVKYGTITWVY